VDKEERELVKRSGVRVFTMKEIDRRGIGNVMDEALFHRHRQDGWFFRNAGRRLPRSVRYARSGHASAGGADYREAHLAMEMVADTGKMVSFEITEINPILDVHNKTANVGMELVLSAFGKQIL
jgi:arginase